MINQYFWCWHCWLTSQPGEGRFLTVTLSHGFEGEASSLSSLAWWRCCRGFLHVKNLQRFSACNDPIGLRVGQLLAWHQDMTVSTRRSWRTHGGQRVKPHVAEVCNTVHSCMFFITCHLRLKCVKRRNTGLTFELQRFRRWTRLLRLIQIMRRASESNVFWHSV